MLFLSGIHITKIIIVFFLNSGDTAGHRIVKLKKTTLVLNLKKYPFNMEFILR